ncbi:DUF6265 family protein [Stenotrophomonas sp. Marseille-Q5258]|uniref:DUF6265 family protein n=1 Tax=Stenotrophomonas sp. Marseille-Q5258 TaxID=2972779 RepID=UPI0021C83BA5|nr:DUF6265 family protein [Stenotrophomonas sp. Marseille-Q5258]
MRRTLLTLGLLTAAGVSAAPPAASDLAPLAWLAGCWARDGADAGSGEQWSTPAGGTMFGIGRTVKGGRTVGFEFMQLRRQDDGALAFIAWPGGQDRTAFRAIRISAEEARFENPDNDFPQRVIYHRDGDTRLLARIEGAADDPGRAVDFPMTRVACDTAPLPR